MTRDHNPELDLTISRVIRAPREAIWKAWTDPSRFAQWWVPEPAICKVLAMELRPGGALKTEISEDGGPFTPHLDACFLAIDERERIVFTNALTAIITLRDHPDGTDYVAYVMHKSNADRRMHEQLGFHDGWGTVIGQLATLVERRS